MAINRKRSRRVVIDGVAYRWLIRSRPTYNDLLLAVSHEEGPPLRVAVELEGSGGSVLMVTTDQVRGQDWQPAGTVAPSDVARWVREALSAGWQPAKSGGPFVTRGTARE